MFTKLAVFLALIAFATAAPIVDYSKPNEPEATQATIVDVPIPGIFFPKGFDPFKREEDDLDTFSQQISYGGWSNELDSNEGEDQGYSDSFYQQRRGFYLDQPVDNQVSAHQQATTNPIP